MKLRHIMRRLLITLRGLALLALVGNAGAATNVVTSLGDYGPGSLRAAVSDALSGDTIIFSVNGTITLEDGELNITTNLNILGPGAGNLAVSGNGRSRVFNVSTGVTCLISGLTIRDGRSANGTFGSPTNSGQPGGGLFNQGTLTLRDCIFTANVTGNGGGGAGGATGNSPCCQGSAGSGGNGQYGGSGGDGSVIYNEGLLNLNGCVFWGNMTGNGGRGGPGGGGGSAHPCGAPGGNGGNGGLGGWATIYSRSTTGSIILTNCTFASNGTGTGGSAGAGGPRGGCCGSACSLTCFPNPGCPQPPWGPGDGVPGVSGSAGQSWDIWGGRLVFLGGVMPNFAAGFFDGMPRVISFRKIDAVTFQFTSNTTNHSPRVLATADISLSTAQWSNLGFATLVTNNLYRFTDNSAGTNRSRFYRMRWP